MVNGNDEFRFRVVKLVGEFGEGVERAGSGGDCANGSDDEEGDREEGGVWGEDEDDIV